MQFIKVTKITSVNHVANSFRLQEIWENTSMQFIKVTKRNAIYVLNYFTQKVWANIWKKFMLKVTNNSINSYEIFTWNFSISQQGVHPFQETWIHNIGFIQDETNLFIFTSRTSKHLSKIFIEILSGVLVVDFDLKNGQTVHPGHKSRQCCLSGTGCTN